MVVAGIVVGLILGRVARGAADADSRRQRGFPLDARHGGPTRPIGWPEVVAVVVVVMLLARFGPSWEVAPYLVVVLAGLATGITDLRSHRIPNRIVLPAMVACALTMAVAAVGLGRPERVLWAGVGAGLYGGILLAIHLASPRGMGRGDVKLAALLGAALGWLTPVSLATVALVLWALIAANALGLLLGLVGAVLERRGRPGRTAPNVGSRAIPFGPPLSIATLAVVLLSTEFVR